MIRLILASESPYRRQLLEEAGYLIEPIAAGIDEPALTIFSDLSAGLMYLSGLKARAVLQRGSRGIILGCDTVGHAAGQIFGKAAHRAEARRMLEAISGTTHEVLTGWTLLRSRDGLSLSGVERTIVTMRPWREDEFEAYLDSGEWVGKCGAYGLQLPTDPFVTSFEGSAANVIGVPLERLQKVLREFPSFCDEEQGFIRKAGTQEDEEN